MVTPNDLFDMSNLDWRRESMLSLVIDDFLMTLPICIMVMDGNGHVLSCHQP